MRGITKDFADAFKESILYNLYEKHNDELFIGVRNNYLNLYYNCDSIAKIHYNRRGGSICCEINKYYLGDNHKEKPYIIAIDPSEICERYEEIKKNSDARTTLEKKAQSKLVLLNNENDKSNWFCIDVEYVKQFNNIEEKNSAKFNCRFDIIAVSKEKPHQVALIELKYGSSSLGGKSGIHKHIEDFDSFCEKRYFENHLKSEIITIIKSQKELGISVSFELPEENDLLSPIFYFITLDNNAKNRNSSTPKQTMAAYLFNDIRWGCKRQSKRPVVESKFGNVIDKNNKFHATFLFSKATLENLDIADIIDGDYDDKVIPQ